MAIRSYKNNTSEAEFRGQRVSTRDLSIFGAGLEHVDFSAAGKNVVVTKIYDGSNNLLNIKFEKASPPTDPETGQFYVRPDLEVKELGYQSGTFRVEYNFWRFMVGNDSSTGVSLKQISRSRTEVRLVPATKNTPEDAYTINSEFFDFSNGVMSAEMFNILVDDIFKDMDEGVTISKIDPDILKRIYNDFGIDEKDFSKLLTSIFSTSKKNVTMRLLERGCVSYGEFLRVFDTTMKEAIRLYFTDDKPFPNPKTDEVIAAEGNPVFDPETLVV